MFDIGFSELMLCFIVALVVLGPERLPKVARTLGQWSGMARGYLRNLTAELDREAQLAELRQQLNDAKKTINEEAQSMRDDVQSTVADATRDSAPKP